MKGKGACKESLFFFSEIVPLPGPHIRHGGSVTERLPGCEAAS